MEGKDPSVPGILGAKDLQELREGGESRSVWGGCLRGTPKDDPRGRLGMPVALCNDNGGMRAEVLGTDHLVKMTQATAQQVGFLRVTMGQATSRHKVTFFNPTTTDGPFPVLTRRHRR